MVDPVVSLTVFGLLVLIAAALFWPRRGLVVRLVRLLRMTERVRIEDALKHLHNCEYAGRSATVESLAGSLEVSRVQSVRLIARLEELGLAQSDGEGLPLTERGREYALRVLRTHRLWERYLADRTGIPAADWHDEAERREHTLSASDTESLAADLGHPLYDPHGDPIPTVRGELPSQRGVALSSLSVGARGFIAHLEDEPREVYEQLMGQGLSPLVHIEVLESGPGQVRFRSDGKEHTLARVAAGNVTVEVLPEGSVDDAEVTTLTALTPGESGRVRAISSACQGPQRRRLLDLGVVPGTEITAELRSAAGDPVAYRIRGALIGLRSEQAHWVQIEVAG